MSACIKTLYYKLLILFWVIKFQYICNLLYFILFGALLIRILLQGDCCIAYMMEGDNNIPTGQEIVPHSSNSNQNDSLTITEINKKIDKIIDTVQVTADIFKQEAVHEMFDKVTDLAMLGGGGLLILKMMSMIPNPSWKAIFGMTSFGTLSLKMVLMHRDRLQARIQRQGPIDRYLQRLGTTSQGNKGPSSDGGNSHNDDFGRDGDDGSLQGSLQQSNNPSPVKPSSNFNTNQNTDDQIDFSEPRHDFGNWALKSHGISKDEFFKLLQETEIQNETVLGSESEKLSIVIPSPLEDGLNGIIKIWTQPDLLSHTELGLIACKLGVFIMYLLSIALMIFFIRHKLIKFFLTHNQWVPQRISHFAQNKLLKNDSILPLFFFIYFFATNLFVLWHLHLVISDFIVEIGDTTVEAHFYLLRSWQCTWILLFIVYLMIIEIFKSKLTAFFFKNIKMPEKMRTYLEAPFSTVYILILTAIFFIIVNYLHWILTHLEAI